MSGKTKTVYVVQMNHFDPIWRRCWDRRIEYRGWLFASYADIQQAVIDDWLSTAENSQATFILEQAVSLRKYLQRRPDRVETFRRLAREGRFELLAAGEVIPDANMPLGESLVRNLLYGILWAEQTLGVPVTTGCRTDGFGSSAQLPQIFRQCEIEWLPLLSYREPDNEYWRGLDGTAIHVRPPYPLRFAGWGGKLAPCPVCRGHGCSACRGRGFDQSHRVTVGEWPAAPDDGDLAVVVLGAEETLPCLEIVRLVADRAANDVSVTYRFGIYRDLAAHLGEAIQRVDDPPPERVSSSSDLALSSSGCWVTRIKLKQRNRRCEHELLAAETLATLSWLRGADYPHEALTEAWRTLVFTHFHDAITATHLDPAYEELMGMYDSVEIAAAKIAADASSTITAGRSATRDGREVAVFNTLSWSRTAVVQAALDGWTAPWASAEDDAGPLPVYDLQRVADDKVVVTFLGREVPALAGKTVRLAPRTDAPPSVDLSGGTIENEHFRVIADEHGITGILDKQTGRELIDAAEHHAGELILERDYGDPWATRGPDRKREGMRGFTRRQAVRRIPGGAEIVLVGRHPGNFHDFEVNWLAWRQRVVLRDGLPYVEFITEVDWDTHNRRLRIAFPTTAGCDAGHYEIPYGTLERQRYDAFNYGPNGINGDWPAIHWAAPASAEGSVAIINRGECSYRIEKGTVLVSLLRSPGTPWCLHEPQFYSLPLFEGMRDAGQHRFALALYPFRGAWHASDVTRQAWSYNAPLLAFPDRAGNGPSVLSLRAAGTMISTFKRAESGQALIVRLYEYAGRGETVELTVPEGFGRVSVVNLLERRGTEILCSVQPEHCRTASPTPIRESCREGILGTASGAASGPTPIRELCREGILGTASRGGILGTAGREGILDTARGTASGAASGTAREETLRTAREGIHGAARTVRFDIGPFKLVTVRLER